MIHGVDVGKLVFRLHRYVVSVVVLVAAEILKQNQYTDEKTDDEPSDEIQYQEPSELVQFGNNSDDEDDEGDNDLQADDVASSNVYSEEPTVDEFTERFLRRWEKEN